MVVKKINILTGNVNQMDLPITLEQLRSWANGTYIQRAMPHLSAEEREFLITGLLPKEQDELYGKD